MNNIVRNLNDITRNFTGIKDVDKKILGELDDRDLLNACMVSKYTDDLCRDDIFWLNRFIKYYGEDIMDTIKDLKPKDWRWKRYYLYSLTLGEKEFNENINNWEEISYYPNMVSDEWIEEVYYGNKEGRRRFYLSRLSVKNFILVYLIDFEENLEFMDRKYSCNYFFTPYRVMILIANFYDEPLSLEEYKKNVEERNPNTIIYMEKQVREGKLKRGNMLAQLTYAGLSKEINIDDDSDHIYYFVNFVC